MTAQSPLSSYVILDNGGYDIKYGWVVGDDDITQQYPKKMPNCIAKIQKSMQTFIGDEISSIQNPSQLILNRPIDRGYLVNWNIEKEVSIVHLLCCCCSQPS